MLAGQLRDKDIAIADLACFDREQKVQYGLMPILLDIAKVV